MRYLCPRSALDLEVLAGPGGHRSARSDRPGRRCRHPPPAWLASRSEPAAATRPRTREKPRARRHQPGTHSVSGMALINILRSPGRSLIAALTLAVGVAGLTVLSTVTLAFRGVVVGSLLGNAVAVQIRGVDYLALSPPSSPSAPSPSST